uniref:Glutathione transferase n=1 Tax=Pyramimonas obovata TaxID=1411642 RepID=A0A7S0MUJ1_9CHLO|mmetsp:Transcript_12984/g.27448  ORF Transcript_12984/g.27448 Transcript_12984/m.27448 type:complete len:210 (+) Transcript_12984:110-739(+)|eukprot:CAMPEP_0118956558 /NCGR_PEP_ID=MMETSP1169-20130426/61643_1 /TAXON_ID=36882 /ORGANISM="Pyramimonas obovata, Strain CCMP722" /LENGTH=209 /DNA_ID=CAMNT_0006904593 /DNA_START=701 /DNA_END=1330 /DNA_ORIENTATION=-
MPKITFSYFPLRGARGEAIRFALHVAGADWENADMTWDQYQAKKASEKDLAWHNGMPVMIVDGKAYTQSLAQLRFAGKLSKLYPEDPVAAMAVDEAMDVCQDILTKCPQDPDAGVKKTKREEYAAGKMKSMMDLLAQRVGESGSAFMVGGDLTIADLVVYFLVKMIREGQFEHVPANYVDAWPQLAGLEKAVPEHPLVKAYYEKFPVSA